MRGQKLFDRISSGQTGHLPAISGFALGGGDWRWRARFGRC
jgi:hypothetical protein